MVRGIIALAKEFCVSPVAVRAWDIPFLKGGTQGVPLNIDADAVYRWLIDNKARSKGVAYYAQKYGLTKFSKIADYDDGIDGNGDGKKSVNAETLAKQIQKQELRLRTAKADREEIARDRDRGLLVELEEVDTAIKRLSSAVRINLKSLPKSLAERMCSCDTPQEAESILSENIQGALSELAKYEYDSGDS